MRTSNYNSEDKKACPFFKDKCLKTECEVYNQLLNRCDISIVAYNLFLVTNAVNKQTKLIKQP